MGGYNPSTWKAEARESPVPTLHGVHSDFHTSLGYIVGPYLKLETEREREKRGRGGKGKERRKEWEEGRRERRKEGKIR